MRNAASKKHYHSAESYRYIRKNIASFTPEIGIILGTGLGGLVKEIEIYYKLNYSEIPHFPVSTVESHHGNLIFGSIAGKRVCVMQGRFHYYEGYSVHEVTFPVSIMNLLGVKYLLVSNACGGVNPTFRKAELMIMRDHINFLFDNPLRTVTNGYYNRKIYDKDLVRLAEQTAAENQIRIRKGVYLSLRGPTLETSAEYRMIRKSGADVVGMSTIPEALMSRSHNMKVLGLSIITDTGFPDNLKPAVLSEILDAASHAEPNLSLLTKKIIEKL